MMDEKELKSEIDRVDRDLRFRFSKLEAFVERIRDEQLSCPTKKLIEAIAEEVSLIKGKMFFWYMLVGLFISMTSVMIGLYVRDYKSIKPVDVKKTIEERMDRVELKLEKLLRNMGR